MSRSSTTAGAAMRAGARRPGPARGPAARRHARVRTLASLLVALAAGGCGPGLPNLPFPTLGGKQLWADERVHCGWRIQRHAWTGHYRLLDPDDWRRAWGDYAACRAALESARAARDLEPPSQHAVVLVHGLIRSKDSLAGIARRLRAEGLTVVSVDYPSALGSVREHAAQLERVLDRLEGVERVSFVTHSLGGLVVRAALARPADGPRHWRRRLETGRLAMIFPPNRGAFLAEHWGDHWLYELFAGPAGQDLRPSAARRIPPPSCPFAVVAGGRADGEGRSARIPGDDDGTVAVREAYLPGADPFVVLDVGHTFGMNDERVARFVVDYVGAREGTP